MKNQYFSFRTVFVLCVVTAIISHLITKPNMSTSKITYDDQITTNEVISRLEDLDKQINYAITILNELEATTQYQYSLANNNLLEGANQNTYSHARKTTNEEKKLSTTEILSIETNVYDSLSLPSTSFHSITSSKDFNMLPREKNRRYLMK